MKRVILLCILLMGCGGVIPKKAIDKAIELCEPNGGLQNIAAGAEYMNVGCNNGATFNNLDMGDT